MLNESAGVATCQRRLVGILGFPLNCLPFEDLIEGTKQLVTTNYLDNLLLPEQKE